MVYSSSTACSAKGCKEGENGGEELGIFEPIVTSTGYDTFLYLKLGRETNSGEMEQQSLFSWIMDFRIWIDLKTLQIDFTPCQRHSRFNQFQFIFDMEAVDVAHDLSVWKIQRNWKVLWKKQYWFESLDGVQHPDFVRFIHSESLSFFKVWRISWESHMMLKADGHTSFLKFCSLEKRQFDSLKV